MSRGPPQTSSNYQAIVSELTCAMCRKLYKDPVLLPCSHSVCSTCATSLLENPALSKGVLEYDSMSLYTSSDVNDAESDKLSLLSETDSGVVCNSQSQALFAGNFVSSLFPRFVVSSFPAVSSELSSSITMGASILVACPVCKSVLNISHRDAAKLPRNRALANVVYRYNVACNAGAGGDDGNGANNANVELVNCQLCEAAPKPASIVCEQCQVFYCADCRSSCHPARGPLAAHSLIDVQQAKDLLYRYIMAPQQQPLHSSSKCGQHISEALTLLCVTCKQCICCLCLQEIAHRSHDVQPLSSMCKTYKIELTKTLTAFSDRLKTAASKLTELKSKRHEAKRSYQTIESAVNAQCDQLIKAIEDRKEELLRALSCQIDSQLYIFDESIAEQIRKQQQATALVHFCIEVLNEEDPLSFLQVVNGLLHRLHSMEINYHVATDKDSTIPNLTCSFNVELEHILQAIRQLSLDTVVPSRPIIILNQCASTSTSITVGWRFSSAAPVEGYAVEFYRTTMTLLHKQIYCGLETSCTIDGLEPNSFYIVRVTAFTTTSGKIVSNNTCLTTLPVDGAIVSDRHQFDPVRHHEDIIVLNNHSTVTSNSFDYRVAAGRTAMSKGEHYWEVVVDRIDADCDIFVGVAVHGVQMDKMLGKDDKGWAMYVDSKRSWFVHAETHKDRLSGGVNAGSVIGIHLNCHSRTLSFYINNGHCGPDLAYRDLPPDIYYPAVSLNRNAQLSLRTASVKPYNTIQHFVTANEDSEYL